MGSSCLIYVNCVCRRAHVVFMLFAFVGGAFVFFTLFVFIGGALVLFTLFVFVGGALVLFTLFVFVVELMSCLRYLCL